MDACLDWPPLGSDGKSCFVVVCVLFLNKTFILNVLVTFICSKVCCILLDSVSFVLLIFSFA